MKWPQNSIVVNVSSPSKTSQVESQWLSLQLVNQISHPVLLQHHLQPFDRMAGVGPIMSCDPTEVEVVEAMVSFRQSA